jgi:hypothetical protein
MANYYTGSLLPSAIVRGSSGDTYGTHHSVLGIGGYMEVATIAQRNAIPVNTINGIYYDGLSSGQRRLGMLVHVYENNIIYHLQPNVAYSVWSGYTNSTKLSALADNNNWVEFLTSGGTTNLYAENISKAIYQLTHGFVVGDIIGFDGINFVKVNTSNANTIEPLGIVSKVADASNFTLTYAGYITSFGMLDYTGGTLVAGTLYYLSSTNGKLTKYPPTGLNEVSRPIFLAQSSSTGVVLQYRGISKVNEGVSYSVFTGYTATTQIYLSEGVTGATNIGFFSGNTGVQTINVLASVPAYSGNYTSLNNYYYRDINGSVQIGSPTYNGILRRGYVSTFSPVKSWIYNTYVGLGNQVGWILVDGNISTSLGQYLNAYQYLGLPYSETEFSYTGGTLSDGYYNNSGNLALDVNGSFYTGATSYNGGPVYRDKTYQRLNFRTLMSKSAGIKITYDNTFVYFSGSTGGGSGSGTLTGATNGLHLIKSGTTVVLGGNLLSGTTINGVGLYDLNITNPKNFQVTACATAFNINKSGFAFTFTGGTVSYLDTGAMKYASDYSANYTPRSIPDVGYINSVVSGLLPKQAVNVATTANIILSGLTAIDGISLVPGMRVLVKDQISSQTNGVYITSAVVWSRSADFDGSPTGQVTTGSYMWVLTGNTNSNTAWVLTTPAPISIGATPLTFVLFNSIMDVVGGTGITVTSITGAHVVSLNTITQAIVNNSITNAGNGLTKAGNTVILGGSLTGNTNINLCGNSISFTEALTCSEISYDYTRFNACGNNNITLDGTLCCISLNSINGTLARIDGATSNIYLQAATNQSSISLASNIVSICSSVTSNGSLIKLCTPNRSITLGSYPGLGDSLCICSGGSNPSLYTSCGGLGITYAGDYSATFVNRSLIDKGFLDNALAGCIVTANNGLTRRGNMISLGGALTGNTTVCSVNVTSCAYLSFNCTTSSISTCTKGGDIVLNSTCYLGGGGALYIGATSGATYYANYAACYTNRSLVDKEYVDNKAAIYNVRYALTCPFYLISSDNFIGVSGYTAGSCACLYLLSSPGLSLGQTVIVADLQGQALEYPITIDGNGKCINGISGGVATINTEYGSITFVYNGFFWSATAFIN